ncbi:MAG: ABC transporter permease, partial [Actinobacteria bacterium]|nr:ABC transporter permease [Actinomycetota bacterium]
KKITNFIIDQKLIFIIIALIIALSIEDKSFFTVKSLARVLEHATIIGIMAAGMTVLLISGSFDLSVGSVMAFTGIVTIMLQKPLGLFLSVLIGLIAGTMVGVINGLLVVKGRINAFIATLGTMVIFKGFGLALTRSSPVKGTIAAYQFIGQGQVFGIQVTLFYLIAMYIIVWYLLKYTKFGRNDYAIGGNILSARLSGINVNLYTFYYFIFCAFTAAVSGIILSSRVNTGNAIFGDITNLTVIASAVLGGTSLFGGRGGVIGTIQGVIILGLIERAMVVFNVDTNYQLLVRGLIILFVVVTDAVTSQRKKLDIEKGVMEKRA